MKQYYIVTDRHTLVQYLTWELGIKAANRLLRTIKRASAWGYRVPLTHNTTRLKRNAVIAANRIAQASAYIDGRRNAGTFHAAMLKIVRS